MNYVKALLRPFFLRVRVVAIRIVDCVVSYIPAVASGSRRVLLVRVDAIGDYIPWLNAARALRRLYPKGEYDVTLLANKSWSELASREDCFDEIWDFDRRCFFNNPLYRFNTLLRVRKAGFAIAIQPNYSREYFFGDAVVRASGAPVRIGSEGDCSNISLKEKNKSDRWYTHLVHSEDKPLMELERNAEFVQGLGLADFKATMPVLASRSQGRLLLEDYFILFPGASSENKMWPLERFGDVARRIHSRTGWKMVLCGGKGETRLGRKLESSSGIPMVNMIGKTSLNDFGALIAGSKLVVANDSSAVHIAAAVSTPSVCVSAGAHHGRFLPYKIEPMCPGIAIAPLVVVQEMDCFGCAWRCVHKVKEGDPVPCISAVNVEKVWENVTKLI